MLGSVQSWSRGHASRTCPVPRTLKPAGVWLTPPPAPSCVHSIQRRAFHSQITRFFHSARPRIRDAGARERPLAPAPRRTGVCRALRNKKPARLSDSVHPLRFSRWRSPKSMSKRLTTRTQHVRHLGQARSSTCSQRLRRLTRRGDSLLTLLHSPLSALCAHMGAGISRLQSMRAPLRRPWPKLGLA